MLQILVVGDSRVAMMETMYNEWRDKGVFNPQDIFYFCSNRGKVMDKFLGPLREFKEENRYRSIKVVVVVGFFNDYVGMTDPDLGPDSQWRHKKLHLKESVSEGELSPNHIVNYAKQYVRSIRDIFGNVFIFFTTPFAIDCARWVAKRAFGSDSNDALRRMPRDLLEGMNRISEEFETHIRVGVLHPLREAFATDVVLKCGSWWRDSKVRGPFNMLKVPTEKGFVNISLSGESLMGMATTDGIHPSRAYALHFLLHLQKHWQYMRNAWRNCEGVPAGRKCAFSCQSKDSPYPGTYCPHWKRRYMDGYVERHLRATSISSSVAHDDPISINETSKDESPEEESSQAESPGVETPNVESPDTESLVNGLSEHESPQKELPVESDQPDTQDVVIEEDTNSKVEDEEVIGAVSLTNVNDYSDGEVEKPLITPDSLLPVPLVNSEVGKKTDSPTINKMENCVSVGVGTLDLGGQTSTILPNVNKDLDGRAVQPSAAQTPIPPYLQNLLQRAVNRLGVDEVAELLMDGLFQ